MKRFVLLLASVAFVTPALAADVVYDEPPAPAPMAAPAGWTGFYLGVQGGGAFNPQDPDNLSLVTNGFTGPIIGNGVDAFGSNFNSSFDSSFIGGGHIGYDYQMGSIVVGAILDINAVDIASSASAFSNTPAFYTAERSIDYLATGRLRAGYTVTPNALAYVTGGVAYGEVDYNFSTNSPAVNATTPAQVFEDEDDFGYTVGGGMEVKVTDNVSFGAEYLYTNLGGGDSFTRLNGGPFDGVAGNPPVAGQSTDFRSNGDFDFHTVTAKISYRFN